MNPIRGIRSRPWRVAIYGTPGIGKSTLAAKAPGAFFLDIEDGLVNVDCYKSTPIKNVNELNAWLKWAYEQQDIKTVIVDTLDALDKILTEKVLSDTRGTKKSLADFGYGKGYDKLAQLWNVVLDRLDQYARVDKNVLLIGHEQVKKYEDPSSEGYDRYIIQIHQKSANVIFNRSDAVLFAKWETFVRGDEDEKKKARGTGKRLLYCQETPALMAKNRFGLNTVEVMDLEGSIFNKLKFGVK